MAALFLLPVSVWGQDEHQLTSNGTWNATTINGKEVVELTDDVTIEGTITIGSENGETTDTLIIKNKAGKTVTIGRNSDVMMFKVCYNSTLTIQGESEDTIVIDGGAEMTWDTNVWKQLEKKRWSKREGDPEKGEDFTEYIGHEYKYAPLKPGEMKIDGNSMIHTFGNLNLEYVRIDNFYGGDNKYKHAIRVSDSNGTFVKGTTNLSNCMITHCRSGRGSAIMVEKQQREGNNKDNCAVNLTNVYIYQCMVNPERIIYTDTTGTTDTDEAWGGVIRFSGTSQGSLNMKNCTMEENYSTGDGSCLWWNSGGEKSLKSPHLTLDGCTFRNNRSGRDAGAVRLESGFSFTGNKTVFEGNSCGRYGGAMQVADYNGGKDRVGVTSFDYDLNDLLDVHDNYAGEAGGGIAFYYISNELPEGFTFNITLNGLTVKNNEAHVRGGGIIFTDLRTENKRGTNYNFNVNLNKGEISSNKATNAGGGIFTRRMTIKTNTEGDQVNIKNNVVTAAAAVETGGTGGGGGIAVFDGSMTLNTCNISNNKVYTSKELDVEVGYGGGILLNRSNFTINGTNNTVSNNSANVGGGVAILNTSEEEKTVQLLSGNITGDSAHIAGGGMAIVGHAKVEINGVNIKNNVASDGGGMYVQGVSDTYQASDKAIATVTYTSGQIADNKAIFKKGESETPLTGQTGLNKEINEISGMGGGLCIGRRVTLELLVEGRDALGISNNEAVNGADDIYCNGKENTKIVLPGVASMKLDDPNADRLFWVEDYITNDTEYDKGTYVNSNWESEDRKNIRYRYAKENGWMSQVFRMSQSVNGKPPKYSFDNPYKGSSKIYEIIDNKYLCLTLGNAVTYILLEKKGMAPRDNAIFKIYRWPTNQEGAESYTPTDEKDLYMTIILTDNDKTEDSTLRRKRIEAEYGYYYMVKETPWSWAYTTDPADGIKNKLDRDNDERTFTFTNTSKPDTPPHSEDVKVNEMSDQTKGI